MLDFFLQVTMGKETIWGTSQESGTIQKERDAGKGFGESV